MPTTFTKAAYSVSRGLANTGVLSGGGPLDDELSIFFVQATIIIGIGRFLSFIGIYLKQPQVIFEIIGGILIGPTALSRDPDFKNTLFSTTSITYLQLVADIGLVLYLFIIGMELDPKLLKSHAKRSGSIAIIGMAVPFALGVAICRTLFDTLQGDDPDFKDANFTAFFVFIGTAMSITAFPVLARILKEGGLIYTKAGTMVMGAAAINDALAWCLLILAISIANASDMAVAGYVFLSVIAMALGLFFIIRPVLWKVVYKVEAYHSLYMNTTLFAFTLCLLFMCSWTTTLLGVHSIFGAFLFGLIIPRDTHLFRECNERIEYLVMVMFLPLYFAISGLKTDITQITEGKQWSMVVLVCFIASIGKFIGCGGPALLSGMTIRESAVVAVLMNTRGLVELIVLNLGLQAGILSTKTFSVMVIMCLFTTFITSPIIECIYPKHMRLRYESGAHEKQQQKDAAAATVVGGYDLDKMQQQLNGSNNNYTDDSCTGGGAVVILPLPLPVKTIPVTSFIDHLNLCVVVDSLSHLQHLMTVVSCFSPYTHSASLAVTAVKFTEPTNSTSDEFLALLNGRLIRVDEEPTGIDVTALHASVNQAKPQLLPLSMLCRSVGSDITAYQVIGDDQEFPAELKLLADENKSDVVLFPWRKNSQYFEALFWGSTRKTPVPIMLLIPRDSEWTGSNTTASNSVVNVAAGVMTGQSGSATTMVTDDGSINTGLKKPPLSSYFLPTDFNFPWVKKSSTTTTSDGVDAGLESQSSPVVVTRRETAVIDMLSESKSSSDHLDGDGGSSLNNTNNYTTLTTTLNDIESCNNSNSSNHNMRFSPSKDTATATTGGNKTVGISPDKMFKVPQSPVSPSTAVLMGTATGTRKGPSKPVTVRSVGAIITGKDTDAHILSMLLRLSSQPHIRIAVYVAHGYKHHCKGTRTAVKLFARAANNVDNIIMYNLTATCEDAIHLFRETVSASTATSNTGAHSAGPGVAGVTAVDLMMSSYILPAAHQYVDNSVPNSGTGGDVDSVSVTGAALTSSRSSRPLSTLLPTSIVSNNRNYLDSSNMTATSSVGMGINNMTGNNNTAASTAAPTAINLPPDYIEQRRRALVPEPLIHTTLTHPELGALGTLQYESNLYKYIAVFHEPTPTIRLARDRAMSMSYKSMVGVSTASVDNENSQSIFAAQNSNGGISAVSSHGSGTGSGIRTSDSRISNDDFGGYFNSMSVSKEVTFNNNTTTNNNNNETSVATGIAGSNNINNNQPSRPLYYGERNSSMDHGGYSVEDLASLASFHTTSTAAVIPNTSTNIPFASTHDSGDDEQNNTFNHHQHNSNNVIMAPSTNTSVGDLSVFTTGAAIHDDDDGEEQQPQVSSDNQNSNTDGNADGVNNNSTTWSESNGGDDVNNKKDV